MLNGQNITAKNPHANHPHVFILPGRGGHMQHFVLGLTVLNPLNSYA